MNKSDNLLNTLKRRKETILDRIRFFNHQKEQIQNQLDQCHINFNKSDKELAKIDGRTTICKPKLETRRRFTQEERESKKTEQKIKKGKTPKKAPPEKTLLEILNAMPLDKRKAFLDKNLFKPHKGEHTL